ncbi:hypothetical protein [Bradyrhizobium uaiense]|uniref:Uncharacterized protein n=1 Tax=Bradyrhizobium uaiense TaxID=2594946 RepID=A0A6P1BGM2_9BRAD|nr:hypothetical protein [Bradyrhizobium uaiense]NEU97555.1 hypothetical protein [Bradyrhizobium uaiense]
MEQFLELVVNFQNDPMAVRIIGSAPLSLPLPHFNSLSHVSRLQAIGAADRDVTGGGSIRTEPTTSQ